LTVGKWRSTPATPVRCLAALACLAAVCAGTTAAQPTAPAVGEARVARLLRRLLEPLNQRLTVPCLTADVSRVFDELTAKDAFRDLLGTQFTLAGGGVYPDHIDLQIRDAGQHSSRIRLAVPESARGTPDGKGRHFLFYLETAPVAPTAQAASVLLAVATLLDTSLPDTVVARCGGGDPAVSEHRYPLALALVSAVAEATIVLLAILFGVRAIRAPLRSPSGPR